MSGTTLQDAIADRKLIDEDLAQFAAMWKQQHTPGSAEIIDAYCTILLRGGKRLRGILAMQSYYAYGGKDTVVALGAARILEIMNTYLLVIDDITDRSDMRRGGPSAHRLIAQRAKVLEHVSVDHYASSQAMNAALAAQHIANLELMKLPVPREALTRALMSLHATIEQTCMGQIEDIYNEAMDASFSEDEIESTLTKKTANYTVLGPLELGACLAGKSLSEPLRQYSMALGCAFQISDDVISTFDDEQESGKNQNDDIREGKMTLLRYYAEKYASDADRETLTSVLGDYEADDASCDRVRKIMIETGARTYAEKRAQWYIDQANQALTNEKQLPQTFAVFLRELSDYVATRKS